MRPGPDSQVSHFAHTAGGRDIRNVWEWAERAVLLGTFSSIILGVIAFSIDYEDCRQARTVNEQTLAAYQDQKMINAATLDAMALDRAVNEKTLVSLDEQTKVNDATLREIEEARNDRLNDAITRAWVLVTTPAGGNSGKVPALEFLASQRIPLIGLNLSCEAMGGVRAVTDGGSPICSSGAYLSGLDLGGANFQKVNLETANLSNANFTHSLLNHNKFMGANLVSSRIVNATADSVDFSFASIWNSDLRQTSFIASNFANIHGDKARFDRANLTMATFSGARLNYSSFRWANLDQADFSGASLSGADFRGATGLETANFSRATAIRALRPKGLEGIPLLYCSYVKNPETNDYEKSDCRIEK